MFIMGHLLGKGLMKFTCGFLLGSAGLAMLGSRPARKVYTHAAAAALLARDRIMEGAEKIQAAASDIIADASEIKEQYNREKDLDVEYAEASEENAQIEDALPE